MKTVEKELSKAHNITLWIVQIILASCLIWASLMKLCQAPEKLATMWPWTAQVPVTLVKLTGIVDLLAAMGLILPVLVGFKSQLIGITAVCIILLMIFAGVFHIARGEASVIGVNIVFAGMASFVAWGRLKKRSHS